MAPHLQPVLEPDAEGGDADADQQHVFPRVTERRLLLFRGLGTVRARLRGRRGAASCHQAPPPPRRSEQVVAWQHSFGWGTAGFQDLTRMETEE